MLELLESNINIENSYFGNLSSMTTTKAFAYADKDSIIKIKD